MAFLERLEDNMMRQLKKEAMDEIETRFEFIRNPSKPNHEVTYFPFMRLPSELASCLKDVALRAGYNVIEKIEKDYGPDITQFNFVHKHGEIRVKVRTMLKNQSWHLF